MSRAYITSRRVNGNTNSARDVSGRQILYQYVEKDMNTFKEGGKYQLDVSPRSQSVDLSRDDMTDPNVARGKWYEPMHSEIAVLYLPIDDAKLALDGMGYTHFAVLDARRSVAGHFEDVVDMYASHILATEMPEGATQLHVEQIAPFVGSLAQADQVNLPV